MILWVKKAVAYTEEKVTSNLFVFSILIGIPCACVALRFPFRRLDVLPHVITYASCNLALVGFVFSILLGIRGGEIYSRIKRRFPKLLPKFYYCVFKITVASSMTVLVSIFIIAVPLWGVYARFIAAYLGIVVFVYMLVGTTFLFLFMIRLMVKDDREMPSYPVCRTEKQSLYWKGKRGF